MKRIIGYYNTLVGYPDLWTKTPVYACRWQFLPMVRQTMFQVKVASVGGLAWINVPLADFSRA